MGSVSHNRDDTRGAGVREQPWHDGLAPLRTAGAQAARRKFLRFFRHGFRDPKYLAWERDYKWQAHKEWADVLAPMVWQKLERDGATQELARRAVRIEARTNLLFSFEKMALRDAVKSPRGAQKFVDALYDLLYGRGDVAKRFDRWCDVLAVLARKQRRVLTWPVATVFGFLAQPERHFFLKPKVTRRAAAAYGLAFEYESRPTGRGYAQVLELADRVRHDLRDFEPRDFIDIQSFLWVFGSDEYD